MKFIKAFSFILIFCMSQQLVFSQVTREPHAGYIYPAGGQRGTKVRVLIGGQFLRQARSVRISGQGVSGTIVDFRRPLGNKQLREIRLRLTERAKAHKAKLKREKLKKLRPGKAQKRAQKKAEKRAARRKMSGKKSKADRKKKKNEIERIDLPENNPLVAELPNVKIKNIRPLINVLFDPSRNLQTKRAISEHLVVELTISKTAKPGPRELRIVTKNGLSEPVRFWVGANRDFVEPAWFKFVDTTKKAQQIPVTIHGQILPREVDRFKFKAKKGKPVLIQTQARELVPFMSDSVPGWFQPVVEVYDSQNRRVAYCDDCMFHPDPVLTFVPEKDDEYILLIRDSIYRGRADFTYMISIDQSRFITSVFPVSTKAKKITLIDLLGRKSLVAKMEMLQQPPLRKTKLFSGMVFDSRLIDEFDLPEEIEKITANDSQDKAQTVKFGTLIHGQLSKPGDVDFFYFDGKSGQDVVIEIQARRLGSAVDSLIYLLDENEKILAWSDDASSKNIAYHTHASDSRIRFTLPRNGKYFVRVSDLRGQSAEPGSYCLRISKPMPGFRVFMQPSGISLVPGQTKKVTAIVQRIDDYQGAVNLKLATDIPGLILTGGVIPAGRTKISMTLTAPQINERSKRSRNARRRWRNRDVITFNGPISLRVNAIAEINGKKIVRRVIPADDLTQAFVLHHIVPANRQIVFLSKSRWNALAFGCTNRKRVKISQSKPGIVKLTLPKWWREKMFSFEIVDAPAGLKIGNVVKTRQGLAVEIIADENAKPMQSNLILRPIWHKLVEVGGKKKRKQKVFTEKRLPGEGKETKPKKKLVKRPMNVVPAIPFEIVRD